jgi:prevent-host-death family protein
MGIAEDIRPISELRSHAARLLDQVKETRRAVVITRNGHPAGVLQDVESYEQLRKAIAMLKLIAQSEADIRAGRVIPHDVVAAQLRRRLKKRLGPNG